MPNSRRTAVSHPATAAAPTSLPVVFYAILRRGSNRCNQLDVGGSNASCVDFSRFLTCRRSSVAFQSYN